ncbi:MAG: YqgE/AlgH family protein [Gemmataceae bacterium]|nr:YqgE/AlgH family protein [Gemmataceae bacterium]
MGKSFWLFSLGVFLKSKRSLTGKFLIARPVLRDPNFLQTVILLLQHDSGGAFGLVLNRPLPPEAWSLPFPLYVGGPCKSEGILIIHNHRDWVDPGSIKERQVAPGLFIGDENSMQRATEANEKKEEGRFRMVTGYSGWGPGQLENELNEGAWAIVPASAGDIFDIPDKNKWVTLLPSAIPSPSDN